MRGRNQRGGKWEEEKADSKEKSPLFLCFFLSSLLFSFSITSSFFWVFLFLF